MNNRVLRLRAIFGLFLVTVAVARESRSELITFAFSGTVTGVSITSADYQGFDFPDVGDPFSGFYTFDSSAPDTANLPGEGAFRTVLPGSAVGATIGKFQFTGQAVSISTYQGGYGVGDHIPSIELTSDPALGEIFVHNNFSLAIIKENLFPNPDTLPLSPPSLVGADQAYLRMNLDDRDDLFPFPEISITASLESLELVPEPSSLLLIAIGLILSGQRRKRHARLY